MQRFLTALVLGLATAAQAAPTVSGHTILYETLAGHEIAAFDVTDNYRLVGVHVGNATLVSASGKQVYWLDGSDIYRANADLSNVQRHWSLGVVPTDFAVDASVNALYVTVPGIGLLSLDLSNPLRTLGVRAGNFSHLAAGAGKLFYQEQQYVWRADSTLAAPIEYFDFEFGFVPTDIAYDAATDLLLSSFDRLGRTLRGGRVVQLRNDEGANRRDADFLYLDYEVEHVAAGGGLALWQHGNSLYLATQGDGIGLSTRFANFGLTPTDIALLRIPADLPGPLPEPGGFWLALLALGALLASARARSAVV